MRMRAQKHTLRVLLVHIGLQDAGVNDENKISERFVSIWTLVLPTLLEKIVELVPLFQLEHGFKFEFDDLKVLGDDVSLGGALELIDAF